MNSVGRIAKQWRIAVVMLAALTIGLAAMQTRGQDNGGGPPAGGPGGPGGGPGGRRGGRGGRGAGGPMDLGAEMSAMNADLTTLKGQISDATKNAASLTAISDLERHVVNAKDLTPPNASTQPDDAKPAYMKAYRLELIKLERTCLDIEEALANNDNAKAADLFKQLPAIEAEGHAEFRARGGAPRGG